ARAGRCRPGRERASARMRQVAVAGMTAEAPLVGRPRAVAAAARARARTRGFYGWRVVGGAFVLAVFGWGVGFYGPPVYLHAVREARFWSVPLVSAAVTLHFLIGAIVVANLPGLYR